jgi:hypothetical protein
MTDASRRCSLEDMTHLIILIVVAALWLAMWILAVRSILRHPGVSSFERGIWIAIVIILPFVGPVAWAAVGSVRRRTPVTD